MKGFDVGRVIRDGLRHGWWCTAQQGDQWNGKEDDVSRPHGRRRLHQLRVSRCDGRKGGQGFGGGFDPGAGDGYALSGVGQLAGDLARGGAAFDVARGDDVGCLQAYG